MGNQVSFKDSRLSTKKYPRMCKVINYRSEIPTAITEEPSLRVRDKHCKIEWSTIGPRTIPEYAGQTCVLKRDIVVLQNHPRIHRANAQGGYHDSSGVESSLHTQGKL